MCDSSVQTTADAEGFLDIIRRQREALFATTPWNQIKGNYYLGQQPTGALNPFFKYVVSCVNDDRYRMEKRQVRTNFAFDDCNVIPPFEHLMRHALKARAYARKGPTLIHCHVGWNRSALTMGLALLMDGMEGEDAIALMRKQRSPFVLCNSLFAWFVQTRAGGRIGRGGNIRWK